MYSLVRLPEISGGQIWSFLLAIISPWFSMLIYQLVIYNRPVVGRSSETYSYAIDMIVIRNI
jgi:hypothetical protein